jgi:hypothetical protein
LTHFRSASQQENAAVGKESHQRNRNRHRFGIGNANGNTPAFTHPPGSLAPRNIISGDLGSLPQIGINRRGAAF